MWSTLQILALGVLLFVIVSDEETQPDINFLVKSLVIFLNDSTVLLLIFGPKIWRLNLKNLRVLLRGQKNNEDSSDHKPGGSYEKKKRKSSIELPPLAPSADISSRRSSEPPSSSLQHFSTPASQSARLHGMRGEAKAAEAKAASLEMERLKAEVKAAHEEIARLKAKAAVKAVAEDPGHMAAAEADDEAGAETGSIQASSMDPQSETLDLHADQVRLSQL